MGNELERELVLYKGVEQSLASLDQGPKPIIQAVLRLNSEVYGHFQIEEFLNMLNQKLFEGKGEVGPWNSYSIRPNIQEEQSRFARLFSARADLSSASSGLTLSVKKDHLNMKKDNQSFDTLQISIFQSMDIEGKVYIFYICGCLIWSPKVLRKDSTGEKRRDSNGNWDSKPVFLKNIYEGRMLSFYLHSVPPIEEISQVLFQQVNEILEELAVKGFIPSLNQNETEDQVLK